MTSLYIMASRGKYPRVSITLTSKYNGPPWSTGEELMLQVKKLPLEYKLDRVTGNLGSLYEVTIPVISDKLLKVIQGAGVKNIKTYPAVLVGPDKKKIDNFKAFNILGLAESKAQALKKKYLIFRADATGEIIVSEKIKKAIEESGINDVIFDGDLKDTLD